MEAPKVFISYSHDSPHAQRVLVLSDRLRQDGVDCHIDQYEMSPPEGWPRWMVNKVEWADFVLVVCTETYQQRFEGKAPVGQGKGVKWEGAILTQALYDAEAHNTRFIPVVFSVQDTAHIPVILRGQMCYDLSADKGYEALYRHLTNQPAIAKPMLGKLRPMPQLNPVQDKESTMTVQSEPKQPVRLFVSSPGDVEPERAKVTAVVNQVNRMLGDSLGIVLEAVDWKTRVVPDMGRPLEVINQQVGDYDIFVGILWKRFGTPTGRAESGTEEEFNIAYANWQQYGRPRILFYFSQVLYLPKNPDEATQLLKVLTFKTELQQKGLIRDYQTAEEFSDLLREHLVKVLQEWFKQKGVKPEHKVTQSVPMQFNVAPWGTTNTAELFNAFLAANAVQNQFHFNPYLEGLSLDVEHYRLAEGGLDLDRAVKDLMRRSKNFRQLASTNLVLVTAEPYSSPGAVGCEVNGVVLPGFFYESDVLGDNKVSIISTFLWDHLPDRPDITVLAPSGRRALQPYLLEALSAVIINKLIYIETHIETFACPNDYCHNVRDVDAFFERGKWFCEERCNPILRKNVVSGKLSLEQWKALKRILNRARGQQENGGFDSCFISYGYDDRDFALRLYRDLKKRNIECWIYDEDSLPGDPMWPSINNARKLAERMLIICSSKSLKREGVKKELELQVDENRDKLIPISVDNEWRRKEFFIDRGLGNLIPFLWERIYADFENRSYYPRALKRLIRSLQWN